MKWTDELIREGIKQSMTQLNLSRMPTADELKDIGRNDLHCKISRTKRYSGWAEDLGIELKSGSETRKGTQYEEYVAKWLRKLEFKVETTSHKHPYDLLVDGSVKVDVKVSNPYTSKNGTKYIFAGMKGMPTCDLFVFVTLENEKVKDVYVVPSHLVKQHTINFKENDYQEYKNSWRIIYDYSLFFKSFN